MIETVDELVMQGRELSQLAADFTWYLRNLLLVKSSDNMEDVLDVSSENLALLKEEAQMIDSDTLIRYIRIFSDLTNQLKYATQKRVLLEVTLIKLCRPAMDQNKDAYWTASVRSRSSSKRGRGKHRSENASYMHRMQKRRRTEAKAGTSAGIERRCESGGKKISG